MGESIYLAFLTSIVRSLLLVGGGWLVSRGVVDHGLMQEVAAGLALIVVTQAWGFWRIHQRALYQRWLLALGLEADPTTDPQVAQEVKTLAQDMTREGIEP